MNGRGRPEKLTDNLKRWIVTHQQGRKKKLKATAIRDDMRVFIEKELRKELEDHGLTRAESDMPRDIENVLPGLSAIQKYLKPTNEKIDKPSPLDTLWHLGTLQDFPLPPEAIPYIILVQHAAEQYPESVTIRQAQWIARLYAIFGNYHRIKGKDKQKVAAALYNRSKGYVTHEIICHLSGTPFDTSELDKALREGSTLVVTGNQWVVFHGDNTFTVDPRTAKQLNDSQKEGEK